MSKDRLQDIRQKAQERLILAQDKWLIIMQKHGKNISNPAVRAAREELELARLNYLNLAKVKKTDRS